MEVIYATTNEGKKLEVQKFIEYNELDIKLLNLNDIGFFEEIEENGETFEENSLIKAKAVKKFCDENNINKIVVTDDAGLVVDALNRSTSEYILQDMQEIMQHKKWFWKNS